MRSFITHRKANNILLLTLWKVFRRAWVGICCWSPSETGYDTLWSVFYQRMVSA